MEDLAAETNSDGNFRDVVKPNTSRTMSQWWVAVNMNVKTYR